MDAPIILIIDDTPQIGGLLKRLAEGHFPEHAVWWVKNGVAGVDLVRAAADRLRLVILDVTMPLMDGNATAVQIRRLAPQVPIMPFTSQQEALPVLAEVGCVCATLKDPTVMVRMPALMRQAMDTPVPPFRETILVLALERSGTTVLQFARSGELGALLTRDQQTVTNMQQARDLLRKYTARRGAARGRELEQAVKALERALSD